jgi:hypothetical protein
MPEADRILHSVARGDCRLSGPQINERPEVTDVLPANFIRVCLRKLIPSRQCAAGVNFSTDLAAFIKARA